MAMDYWSTTPQSALHSPFEQLLLFLKQPPCTIPWEQLFLSNSTRFIDPEDGRRARGLTSCGDCKQFLLREMVSKYVIANGFFCSTPPHCLFDLTEVELAFHTPVKTYHYCFSFLVFWKVSEGTEKLLVLLQSSFAKHSKGHSTFLCTWIAR
jgi:hypothetical protein